MPFSLKNSLFTVCGFKDYEVTIEDNINKVDITGDKSLLTYPSYEV